MERECMTRKDCEGGPSPERTMKKQFTKVTLAGLIAFDRQCVGVNKGESKSADRTAALGGVLSKAVWNCRVRRLFSAASKRTIFWMEWKAFRDQID
jgi:hypothetical protein